MDITLVFNEMVMMMLLLLVGVVVAKAGVVDAETNRRMTRFALVVPQSAVILSSAVNMEMEMTPGKVLLVLAAGAAMYALLVVMGLLAPKLYRFAPSDRGLFSFLAIFGNVSYMGFPLVRALFGSDAVFYAALLSIPFNCLAYTLGVRLVSSGTERGLLSWKQFVNPPLVSSLLAIVIIFLPIDWPGPVVRALGTLGDMILPLSMIIIGASLGSQKLKDVLGDWRVYAYVPVRLIVAPVLLWLTMRPFLHDELLFRVIVLLGATPSAAMAAMLCIEYHGNERLASRTIFVSTVLSVVTIPLICWALL